MSFFGNPPDFAYEQDAAATYGRSARICGVDEVGRGCWAGPVVAAAIILDPATAPTGLNDSKKLSRKRRDALFEELQAVAEIGLGQASVAEIDAHNILQASLMAMRRAIGALPAPPNVALIDGRHVPHGLNCQTRAIIGGDALSASVAAASIIAKVTRDRIMADLARHHPHFEWERNAGYGVPAHRRGLQRFGLTPHHRRSFRPIHKMLR